MGPEESSSSPSTQPPGLVSMLLPLQPLPSALAASAPLTPQLVSQGGTLMSLISHSRAQTQVMSRKRIEDHRI